MHYMGWNFWGMHFFWWLFWVLLIASLLFPDTPVSRGRRRETPLEILQRRYAAGEIETAEYEERKATLERDASTLGNSG
jgi:putative membrane protein